MNTQKYIQPLKEAFEVLADKDKAVAMSKYMLNKFEFYGVMTKDRRFAFKEFLKDSTKVSKDEAIEIALAMWNEPKREFHYCAIEFLEHYRKLFDEHFIFTIEKLITEHSWWDTVDTVSAHLLRYHLQQHPQHIKTHCAKWNKSNNLWLQRVSIIFQNKWKDKTDTLMLSKHILNCAASNEFFIRKAIGWALREYAYVNPEWVRNFVTSNKMSGLSKREALKNIS